MSWLRLLHRAASIIAHGTVPAPVVAALEVAEEVAIEIVGELEQPEPSQPLSSKDVENIRRQVAAATTPPNCPKRPGQRCQGDYGMPMRCEWCDRELD